MLLFLKLHKPFFKKRNSSDISHKTPQGYPDTSSQQSSPTPLQFCCARSSLLQSNPAGSDQSRLSPQHTLSLWHFWYNTLGPSPAAVPSVQFCPPASEISPLHGLPTATRDPTAAMVASSLTPNPTTLPTCTLLCYHRPGHHTHWPPLCASSQGISVPNHSTAPSPYPPSTCTCHSRSAPATTCGHHAAPQLCLGSNNSFSYRSGTLLLGKKESVPICYM